PGHPPAPPGTMGSTCLDPTRFAYLSGHRELELPVEAHPSPHRERVVTKQTVLNLAKYLLAFGLLGYVIHANWAPASGRGLGYVWQGHVGEGIPVNAGALLLGLVVYTVAVMLTLVR